MSSQESAQRKIESDRKVEEMNIKEMSKLVSEGKATVNELIKALVDSITPLPKKKYVTTKKKQSKEAYLAYQKQYYQKHKNKRAEDYQKNKELLIENQKKYYRLKKIKELADVEITK